jgi:hypothetical protein
MSMPCDRRILDLGSRLRMSMPCDRTEGVTCSTRAPPHTCTPGTTVRVRTILLLKRALVRQ